LLFFKPEIDIALLQTRYH